VLHPEIDDLAMARNAFAIENLELGLFEWRRNLVLDDLDARLVADDLVAFPVVVSGLPNITPIFMRIWLMKTTIVLERWILAVSFLSACDISRACRPICESPISPSISAFGVSAATESTITISTAPERTSMSVISSACSPVSGCETRSSSTSTPSFSAYDGSSACSASTNAAVPPSFCDSAITCNVSVVLPDDSGP
jgi:hypothetical protein